MTTTVQPPTNTVVITPEALLDHWQGHRKLTRKLIEAYPEDKLFTFSIGGMRPASEFIIEMLGMAVPGLNGVITGTWQKYDERLHFTKKGVPTTKAELLQAWDETTERINALWPQIPAGRFQEHDLAFGQW